MSKSSGDWINTQGVLYAHVPKAEYDALKAEVLKLRIEVNELQHIAGSRGVTLDRLREAVQKLREGL